jgi:hypothetical protein
VPGIVAEVADQRLHQQAGDGGGQPQDGQLVHFRTQGGKDAAGVGVLQRKAELDAEKAEAHVPELPKAQPGLDGW